MYKDYFGFKENPFSIAPNPRYLYMSTMHQEALAHLVYGTTSEGCITLLTGEVGTGKTTISRYFLNRLPKDTVIAVIINPKLTADELLATICDEFQVTVTTATPTTKTYIDSLNHYLLEAHSSGSQAVLMIDEAQNLDLEVLEMLRLLTNLETDRRKLLKIFLLGQSELLSILSRPDLEQINQRITGRYHLKELERDDVSAYISHRISVAGGGRTQLFSRGAVKEIYKLSRGIPRLINSLCDCALLGAYSENRESANSKIVKKAATEIFENKQAEKKTSFLVKYLLAPAGITAVLLTLVWYGREIPPSGDQLKENIRPVAEQKAKESPPPVLKGTLYDNEPMSEPLESGDQSYTTKIIIQPVEVVN